MLLVFDVPSSPEQYHDGLVDSGFDVLLETDFGAALVTATVQLPDVIVVDVRTHQRECARFLQQVFCNERTQSIPLVLVTDSIDRLSQRVQARPLSLYPRFQAPYCLGAHLRRWFTVPDEAALAGRYGVSRSS